MCQELGFEVTEKRNHTIGKGLWRVNFKKKKFLQSVRKICVGLCAYFSAIFLTFDNRDHADWLFQRPSAGEETAGEIGTDKKGGKRRCVGVGKSYNSR